MQNVEYVTTRRTTVTTNRKANSPPEASRADAKRAKWRAEKREQRQKAKATQEQGSFAVTASGTSGLWSFSGELPLAVVTEMLAVYQRHSK